MNVHEAIRSSGSTWSAYRYHNGELIWAFACFSQNTIRIRGAHGTPPAVDKFSDKNDWKPWIKGQALNTESFTSQSEGENNARD